MTVTAEDVLVSELAQHIADELGDFEVNGEDSPVHFDNETGTLTVYHSSSDGVSESMSLVGDTAFHNVVELTTDIEEYAGLDFEVSVTDEGGVLRIEFTNFEFTTTDYDD